MKRRKRKHHTGALVVLCAVLAGVTVLALWITETTKEYQEEENQARQEQIQAVPIEENGASDENRRREYTEEQKERSREIYYANRETLILVNKNHKISGEYDPKLRKICKGRLMASSRLYQDLCELLEASPYSYWIASAYRTEERQQELIDEDIKKYQKQGMDWEAARERTLKTVMPAGYSEHQTGLALDILCSENTKMDISQANEKGNQWLAEHAHLYGFILRYPEDKEDITGILYEPWHFRYVGREAAKFLYENDMTLEEFYECLDVET